MYAIYDPELPLEAHLAVLTSYPGTSCADNDIYVVLRRVCSLYLLPLPLHKLQILRTCLCIITQ